MSFQMTETENSIVKLENDDVMETDDKEPAQKSVQELMPEYYKNLFPSSGFFKWLSYGNNSKHPQADASFFRRREFCFTLHGDIFVRYQSFTSDIDLQSALSKKCPSKIDLGPVYSRELAQRSLYGSDFQPIEREFVIDIDIDGYDDVRSCGSGAHICQRCWPLMACGIQVLDSMLRKDFGFNHILWVFSGRRGVHCWVCDQRARNLSNDQRGAILTYLSIYKGVEKENINLSYAFPPYPSIKQAYLMLEEKWVEHILPNQMILTDPQMTEKALSMIGDKSLQEEIRGTLNNMLSEEENSVQKWKTIKNMVQQKAECSKEFKDRCKLQKSLFDIVFAFTYPRMDIEVSKKMNHLLKAPFCIHPKTGNVCVPIDPKHAFKFVLSRVPNVHQLTQQLQQNKENEGEKWRDTDLREAILYFQQSFLQPLNNHNNSCLSKKEKRQSNLQLEW